MKNKSNVLLGNFQQYPYQECHLNLEKKKGQGEDADPLFIAQDDLICLAVFDGLGGSGNHRVVLQDGSECTGAFFASRQASSYLKNFVIQQHVNILDDLTNFKLILEQYLNEKFTELNKHVIPPKFKSDLLKNFPTTMASLFLSYYQEKIRVISAWAGDSRCYVLTASGMRVLSDDDTAIGIDSSLSDYTGGDAIMDNCLSSDNQFTINIRQNFVDAPCIFITATDGCFAYLETAFHFEFFVIQFILASHSLDEWRERMSQLLRNISGDDSSMNILLLGFKHFDECKAFYTQRYKELSSNLQAMTTYQATIDNANSIVSMNIELLNKEKNNFWEKYKEQYFSLLSEGNKQ